MKNKTQTSDYPLVQKFLLGAKFSFSICHEDSIKELYFIKATYPCLTTVITYYLSVPRNNDYLKAAKQEINRLIMDDTLCIYTLKIIPYEVFEKYATR